MAKWFYVEPLNASSTRPTILCACCSAINATWRRAGECHASAVKRSPCSTEYAFSKHQQRTTRTSRRHSTQSPRPASTTTRRTGQQQPIRPSDQSPTGTTEAPVATGWTAVQRSDQTLSLDVAFNLPCDCFQTSSLLAFVVKLVQLQESLSRIRFKCNHISIIVMISVGS